MLRPVVQGTTNVSTIIRILDSTTFLPETGVDSVTSGLSLEYRRDVIPGNTPLDKVAITPASLASLTTAHTDGGIEHIGNGYYRLDVEDAAFAAGAVGVVIEGTVTGMVIIGVYHPLVVADPYDLGQGVFLDRLFAVDYDPASPPGVATALLNELTQDDGAGVAQFTEVALALAPFSPSGQPQLDYSWDTNTAETDPGAGDVKGDNADLSLITELYISATDDGGGDVDVFFAALSPGDTISLNKVQNPSSRVVMRITATIDNTGWWTLAGTVLSSNNSFSNNDKLVMVLNYQANTAAGIADAVYEELTGDHLTPGTFGRAFNDDTANLGSGVGAAEKTTISVFTSNVDFTLVDGSADDNAYEGWGVLITDAATAVQKAFGIVEVYTGGTKRVQLLFDPGVFTFAATDIIDLIPANLLGGLSAQAKLDTSDAVYEEAQLDHLNPGTFGGAFNQDNATIALQDPASKGIVPVAAIAGTLTTTSATTDFAGGDETLERGTIIFISGTAGNVFYRAEVVSNVLGLITWDLPAPFAPAPGDTMVIV